MSIAEMIGNYDLRKIDRYSGTNLEIDTCAVTDSDKPYETAIADIRYAESMNHWIIVELYDTKKAAVQGHQLWVKKMTAKKPPSELVDVSSNAWNEFVGFKGQVWKLKEPK